jgi:membrane protein implicated in regulation of membrane protease activity
MFRKGWLLGCFELLWPLNKKWFWMLFFVLLATLLGAYLFVFLIISVAPNLLFVMLIAVLVIWFLFSSYRKWARDKRNEDNKGDDAPE